MKLNDLKSMKVDELWQLHSEIESILMRKLSAEKAQLEKRLRQLGQVVQTKGSDKDKPSSSRRPYPQVFPKYRNPAQPSETWAGRGKQPRWLTAELKSGRKLDEFKIPQQSSGRARRYAR